MIFNCKYQCPICYHVELTEPYKHCNYDICPVCGVEYGYDDYVDHDDLERLQPIKHAELREAWIAAGKPDWRVEREHPNFTFGVSWLKEYYSDQQRREKWENDLASQFKRYARVSKKGFLQ